MKTKIAIIIDHFGTGGAQQQVVEYLKNADTNTFDIIVGNLNDTYDALSPTIRGPGFTVIGLRFNPIGR